MDVKEYLEGGRNDGVVRGSAGPSTSRSSCKRGMFGPPDGERRARRCGSGSRTSSPGCARAALRRRPSSVQRPAGDVDGRLAVPRGLPAKLVGPQLNAKTGEIADRGAAHRPRGPVPGGHAHEPARRRLRARRGSIARAGSAPRIPVQFNPTSLRLQMTNTIDGGDVARPPGPAVQRDRSHDADRRAGVRHRRRGHDGQPVDVRTKTDAGRASSCCRAATNSKQAPPRVQFRWGASSCSGRDDEPDRGARPVLAGRRPAAGQGERSRSRSRTRSSTRWRRAPAPTRHERGARRRGRAQERPGSAGAPPSGRTASPRPSTARAPPTSSPATACPRGVAGDRRTGRRRAEPPAR